ncbi:MAG TPA: arginine--tRNA ligase, partial [Euryarchaeota archaeon]|nr:arginine--tRNA ligase [Euryarchaeota archaeon]
KRSPGLTEDEKRRIAEVVGIGAIKYALISVSPLKQVVFKWENVLSFERNSAPFIQYAHARAFNILAKAGAIARDAKPYKGYIQDSIERDLIILLSKFPDVISEAADKLRPDLLAEYANNLALLFNSFYDKLPVLRARPKELMLTRLWIVKIVQIVLKNALNLLGIEAPKRM